MKKILLMSQQSQYMYIYIFKALRMSIRREERFFKIVQDHSHSDTAPLYIYIYLSSGVVSE